MLRGEGAVWRSLREKSFLPGGDAEGRVQFANNYGSSSAQFWCRAVSLDNKKRGSLGAQRKRNGAIQFSGTFEGEEGGGGVVTAGGSGDVSL